MWGYSGEYGWGGMGMGVGMLIFWGILIFVLVLVVRILMGAGVLPPGKREKSALDILKERYARGEIEREEFEQKQRDLQQ